MTTQSLKLAQIIIDAGTQSRSCITEDVVTDYADRMTRGDEFPAIIVFHDGTDYFLADGFHRLLAAKRIKCLDIKAQVESGAKLDAIRYSIGANVANGLRRTASDKRRAIVMALENFLDLSDRAIADICAVSHTTVAECRREVVSLGQMANTQKRTGKDGRQFKSSHPKPAIAPEPEPEDPPHIQTADEKFTEAMGGTVPEVPIEDTVTPAVFCRSLDILLEEFLLSKPTLTGISGAMLCLQVGLQKLKAMKAQIQLAA